MSREVDNGEGDEGGEGAGGTTAAERRVPTHGVEGTRQRVEPMVEAVVQAASLDLIELRLTGSPRRSWRLAIFIDRLPGEGSVSIAACMGVSRRLNALLDVEDLFDGPWELEVSSPGINRRLRGEADFLRYRGTTARLSLRSDSEGGKESVKGVIDGCEGGRVSLKMAGDRQRVVDLAEVDRAELSPTPQEWQSMGKQIAAQNAAREMNTMEAADSALPNSDSQGEA